MKRKLLAAALALSIVAVATGCDKKDSNSGKLPTYKGIEVEQSVANVTDQTVEQAITSVLENNATTKQVKKGKVKDGDTVNIDYVGVLDGEKEPFENGSDTGASLTIGSNSFIDGFEEGLIGKKVGETVKLNIKFPDDYKNDPTKAGKKVTFTVTINAIEKQEIPELTDEFVAGLVGYGDCKTVEELRTYVRERLSMNQILSKIWMDLVLSYDIRLDKSEREEVEADIKNSIETQAKNYSSDVNTIVQYLYGWQGEYEDFVKQYAEYQLKEPKFIRAVAEKENISVSDEEYNKQLKDFAENQSVSEAEVESYYEQQYDGGYRYMVLAGQVQEFIAKNVKIVEDKVNESESAPAESSVNETKENESSSADEKESKEAESK